MFPDQYQTENQSGGNHEPILTPTPVGEIKPPKKSPFSFIKNLPISVIAAVGGGIVVVVIIVLLLVFGGGETIGSLSELKTAIANRVAANCTIHLSNAGGMEGVMDDTSITIQTDDGWSNVRYVAQLFGENINTIAKKTDAGDYTVYNWMNEDVIGYRSTRPAEDIETGVDLLFTNITEEEVGRLDCQPNRRANFNIPSNINFSEEEVIIDDELLDEGGQDEE